MKNLSLIDYLAAKINCCYISDLRYLDQIQRIHLAREVEKILPPDYTNTLPHFL